MIAGLVEFFNNNINLFDFFFLVILIYNVVQCFLKGFSLSLISFMKWILATIITIILVPKLQPIVSRYIESEFINNGFVIPYPDDPFEMKSGPFYLGNQDGKTIVSIRVGRSQCNSNLVAHGGLLMTLADLAVCHEACKGDEYGSSITVSLTANFQP